MKEIPLSQGKVALVDDADYEWLSQWKWCIKSARYGYAVRYDASKKRFLFMQREIMRPAARLEVAFVNGNNLDNRRSNLRVGTRLENFGVTTAKFWSRVQKGDGCWLWKGSLTTNGYGHVKVQGRWIGTHKLAYQLTYGAIPDDLCVCHHCDNRECVNPTHLFLGTHLDNMLDMQRKGRSVRGSKHVNARLTEEQVRQIRSLYVPRKTTLRQLGEMFEVDAKTIHRVVRREQWAHVDADLAAA